MASFLNLSDHRPEAARPGLYRQTSTSSTFSADSDNGSLEQEHEYLLSQLAQCSLIPLYPADQIGKSPNELIKHKRFTLLLAHVRLRQDKYSVEFGVDYLLRYRKHHCLFKSFHDYDVVNELEQDVQDVKVQSDLYKFLFILTATTMQDEHDMVKYILRSKFVPGVNPGLLYAINSEELTIWVLRAFKHEYVNKQLTVAELVGFPNQALSVYSISSVQNVEEHYAWYDRNTKSLEL